ncbi:MAG: hypothetical protein ACKO8U_16830 [Pirellula sp.]
MIPRAKGLSLEVPVRTKAASEMDFACQPSSDEHPLAEFRRVIKAGFEFTPQVA